MRKFEVNSDVCQDYVQMSVKLTLHSQLEVVIVPITVGKKNMKIYNFFKKKANIRCMRLNFIKFQKVWGCLTMYFLKFQIFENR